MRKFYYSYRQVDGTWGEQPQYYILLAHWQNFVDFCYRLSYHLNKEIRGCESKGYNNQGSYFLANQADYCCRAYSVEELVEIYKSDPNCSPELWISSEALSKEEKELFVELVGRND